jgi:hypothetical protein
MSYVTPVTDRTDLDISTRTTKGHFNLSDWTRIYGNALFVRNYLQTLLGITIPFTTITAPTITTIASFTVFNTLLTNINTLIAGFPWPLPWFSPLTVLRNDWAGGQTAQAPDFEIVNQWEEVLDTAYTRAVWSSEYWIRCGVGTCGADRQFQQKFRRNT